MRMKRTLPNPPGAGGPRARSRWLRAALLQTLLAALCAGAGLARPAGAQDVLDHHVTLTLEAQPMKKVLSQLERLAAVRFVYSYQLIGADRRVSVRAVDRPLAEVLNELLPPLRLRYEVTQDRILLAPVPGPAPRPAAGPGGPAAPAADVAVAGRVTSAGSGEPLPGVTVLVKGSSQGLATGTDGRFALAVPAGSVLVFSSIGFVTQEVTVDGPRADLVVVLAADVKALGEVVVVAYGTQRRTSVTGAVSTVAAPVFEGRPVVSAAQALQGAAPNLIVQQNSAEPGAPLNLNIRGVGTLGNSSPLVIVDGIPGSLNALNPNDIESVSVLKDAASAAIYGSRAANGVLLVTTKKGATNTAPVLAYNTLVGYQTRGIQRRAVTGLEFMQLKNEALANSGQAPQFSPQQVRDLAAQGDYEWYGDAIYKSKALQQNHNLSLSGGSGTTRYLFSLGYVKQNSLFVGDDYNFNRANLRLNLTTQVTPRLRVGAIVAYARVATTEHPFDTQWIVGDAVRIPRIYPLQNAAGSYLTPPTSGSNPVNRLLNGGQRTNRNDNGYGNLNAEYELVNGLRLRGIVGGDLWHYRQDEFQRALQYVTPDGSPSAGADGQNVVQQKLQRTLLTNYQTTLNYDHNFTEKHAVQALVGYSSEHFTDVRSGARVTGIPGNQFGTIGNGTAAAPISDPDGVSHPNGTYGNADSNPQEWAINSVLGRVNYAFANKYLLEGSFRYDGSSRFRAARRWGFFPSVSAGWRVLEEPFAAGLAGTLSDLKVRASLGRLGNQNIGLYRYLSTVVTQPGTYSLGGQLVPGAYFNPANPDITWEKATMGNVGLDLGLFNNGLVASVDYFDKRTRDILIDLPVAGTYGAGAPTQNAASVRNRGWEVALTYRLKSARGFAQSLALNLADNLNTVTSLNTLGNAPGQDIIKGGDTQNIIREGFPIGSYYGYRADGYFQSLEQIRSGPRPDFVAPGTVRPGDIRYVDRNGDGVINEQDRFVLGNPFPRYTFGATYTGAFKGFDLLVFVQGVGKRSLYLRGEAVEAFHNNWENVYQQHLDRWTPTNPNADYPRLTIGTASTNNNQVSDFWLRDASYARLKNVQLGYTLPAELTKRAGIERLRLYVSGQDLYTLTKLKTVGFDPEISEFSESVGAGVTANALDGKVSSGRVYPSVRTVAVGLDVSF